MLRQVISRCQHDLRNNQVQHRASSGVLSIVRTLISCMIALLMLAHTSALAAYDNHPIYHAYRAALRATTATPLQQNHVNSDIKVVRQLLSRMTWASQFEFQTFMSIQRQDFKIHRRLFKAPCDLTGETARAAFFNLQKAQQPDAILFHFDIFVEEAGTGAEGLVINYYDNGSLQAAHIWIEIAGARTLVQTVAPRQSTWTNKSWRANAAITDDGVAPKPYDVFKALDEKNILSALITQLYYTFSGQAHVRAMDKFLETTQCAETEDRSD